MPATKDITGMRFGQLVATRFVETINRRSYWEFACDCGGTRISMAQIAKCGDAIQCAECSKKSKSKRLITHNMTGTRIHSVWTKMRGRCMDPNNQAYYRYGGRGISVCSKWNKSSAFFDWAFSNGYADNLEIDRIDNDGNYEPANCRFVTHRQNCNNTSRTIKTTYKGELVPISILSDITGLKLKFIWDKVRAGLNGDQVALLSPNILQACTK